ncbi:hypothetical protein ACFPVT_08330 [Corynebacterium choanae]|nr:hypothetical protein [Corynebacterium choanae]
MKYAPALLTLPKTTEMAPDGADINRCGSKRLAEVRVLLAFEL